MLQLLGSGTVTLNGTNSYSGGTVVSAGQLNINNGGDATYGTAIGTGPLTINAGATIDNTSGADVTLQTNILRKLERQLHLFGLLQQLQHWRWRRDVMGNSLSIGGELQQIHVGDSISENGRNLRD